MCDFEGNATDTQQYRVSAVDGPAKEVVCQKILPPSSTTNVTAVRVVLMVASALTMLYTVACGYQLTDDARFTMRLIMVYERSRESRRIQVAFTRSCGFTDPRGCLVEFDQVHWSGSTGRRSYWTKLQNLISSYVILRSTNS